jgi:hypothetical protein
MAMHKPKKIKRFQDGGYLLDGSGKRVKSGSGEDVRTGSYDKEADIESARKKLASEVQEMVKARSDSERVSKDAAQGAKAPTPSAKVSDGMDESDRRREAAESAPKRMPTRPGQGTSGRKPSVSKVPKKPESSAPASKPADKPTALSATGDYSNEGRRSATPASKPAASNKKPEPFEMPISKFFRGLRARGEKDLAERGMKKGGSINGIAKRGLTKCKMR